MHRYYQYVVDGGERMWVMDSKKQQFCDLKIDIFPRDWSRVHVSMFGVTWKHLIVLH